MPTLLHVFPSFEVGGAQMRTARLIAGFGPSLEHRILALDGCRDAERFLPSEASVTFVDDRPPPGSAAATRFHRSLLARERPDLVCTYNWGSIDAALAARLPGGPPLVHHEDGFGRDELERPLRRRSIYRRLVLGGARAVIVPSTRLEDVARRHWRLPHGRVHLVPNGIELARYAPADRNPELRSRLGIPADALLLGSVGGLRPEKNFGRLVDLHAALPPEREVWLLVVGDGVEREALERRAAEGSGAGRVRFVGLQRDPIPYLRTLDLFALTSDTEQMPIALVEAMACALPAVASDVGDTRRVLPAGAQDYVVPVQPGSPAAERASLERLAALTLDLLDGPERRRALGVANRERVAAEFTLQAMLDRYRELYDRALGSGKALPPPLQ